MTAKVFVMDAAARVMAPLCLAGSLTVLVLGSPAPASASDMGAAVASANSVSTVGR